MFYLMMHSTHFNMVIWRQTYGNGPFRLAAIFHIHHPTDRTEYTTTCYTSCGTLAVTRNSSMGPPWRIDPMTHRNMSDRSYHRDTSCSKGSWWQLTRSMENVLTNQLWYFRSKVTKGIICTKGQKAGKNFLFINALKTFYLQLNGIWHIVKDHLDSKRGNMLLPLHGLLFLIINKGSFICILQKTGYHITCPFLYQLWSTSWNDIEK